MRVLRFAAVAFLLAFASRVDVAAAGLPTGFSESLVAGGLGRPTAMTFAPDGRLFVCIQDGQLRVIKNGALLPTPFLSVPVDATGERGLLGVAFDPQFATNHFVYVYYTATTPATHNRVSRFTANGDIAVAGSEMVLFDLDNLSTATNHNGGAIHFGYDGKLYIGVGDNANSANAQSLATVKGKVLRINTDSYGSIPADNPFYQQTAGLNRAIWALGLRNPFTFAFLPFGARMFINDVGQDTFEEINDGIAGSNYGWPNSEGPTSNPNERGPLYFYGHGTGPTLGCAIAGGAFYNPDIAQFPSQYYGMYFFADFCGGWINMLDPSNPNAVTGFASGISYPVDLQVGPDGDLYYLAQGSGGFVSKIFHTGAPTGTISASPGTIQVCDGSGQGVTTLSWTVDPGVTAIEVHFDSPTGPLFSRIWPNASKNTGKYMSEGMKAYLQDVSGGLPLTAAHTLATVTVHTTTAGCAHTGTISASPNPIHVCDGSGQGATTLTWTTSAVVTSVEVHLDSPVGPLFSRIGPSGSKATGKYLTDGRQIYLQDTTGGLPLTPANTLASVQVHLTCP